jgi:hypothetical protein
MMMYKDVQRCTNSVEFTHSTSSQAHDIPSDLMFYISTCCSWCYASPEQTHQLLDCRDRTVENSSTNPQSHSLRSDFDFESDSHFPPSPKMSTFIFKACAVQNKSPESSPPPKKTTQLCMTQRFITPPPSS